MANKRDPFAVAMTSMIDMAFILLLFFIIAMVLVPEDLVPIKLPSNYAEGERELTVDDDLMGNVLRNGAVLVENQMLADSAAPDSVLFARADTLLAQYKQAKPDGKIILKSDSGSVWDRSVQVMQAAGRHAVTLNVALEPTNYASQHGQTMSDER